MAVHQSTRLGYLDSLRGLAAYSVLVMHVLAAVLHGRVATDSTRHWVETILVSGVDLGRFGVVLFFLISGFVIPYSLGGDRPIRRFAISRAFRLYPVFWIAVLVTVAYGVQIDGRTFTARQVLANLTMAPQMLHEPVVSGIYWTLFVELVFYGCCAVLYRFRLLKSPEVLAIIAGVSCLSILVPVVARAAFAVRLPTAYLGIHLAFLFLGTLIRLAYVEGVASARIIVLPVGMLSLVSVAVAATMYTGPAGGFVYFNWLSTVSAYVLALSVFAVAVGLKCPRSPWLVESGKWSYSLYLFHWPICGTIIAYLQPMDVLDVIVALVVSSVISLVVSGLAYRFVELPTIAVGKRLSQAFGASR